MYEPEPKPTSALYPYPLGTRVVEPVWTFTVGASATAVALASSAVAVVLGLLPPIRTVREGKCQAVICMIPLAFHATVNVPEVTL